MIRVTTRFTMLGYLSRSLIGLCLLLSAVLVPLGAVFGVAQAQDSLKQAVIDDCARAHAELQKLTLEERNALVPYLALVLGLKLQQSGGIPANGALPERGVPSDAKSFDPSVADLWRSFEPTREIAAKRCATDLLLELGPRSVAALPSLVNLIVDPTAPVDLVDRAEHVLNEISIAAAVEPALAIHEEVISALMKGLSAEGAFYASRALLELGPKILKQLVVELGNPTREIRDAVADILLRLDRRGDLIGSALLEGLKSSDDTARRRVIALLAHLPEMAEQSLPAILERLTDISASVGETARKALHDLFSASQYRESKIAAKLRDRLLQAFATATADDRAVIAVGLEPILAESTVSSALISAYEKSSNPLLRRDLLVLLAGADHAKTDALYAQALRETDLGIQLAAVRGLALRKGDLTRVLELYRSYVRRLGKNTDLDSRQAALLQVADGIGYLRPGRRAADLVPPLIEALAFRETVDEPLPDRDPCSSAPIVLYDPVVRGLVGIGGAARDALVKALGSRDAVVRRRAATVLGKIRPLEAPAVDALIGALQDTNTQVRDEAWAMLLAAGESVVPRARRALANASKAAQPRLAELLILAGVRDRKVLNVLLEGLSRLPCLERARLAGAMAGLDGVKSAEKSGVSQLAVSIVSCLGERPAVASRMVEALRPLAPLSGVALRDLSGALEADTIDKNVRLALIEESVLLGVAPERVRETVIRTLKEQEDAIKARLMTILAQGTIPVTPDLIVALKSIFEDHDREPLLRNETAATITRLDPQAIDYQKFFVDELGSDRWQWAERSARKLSPALLLPILKRGFSEIAPLNQGVLLDLAAGIAADAGGLIEQIVPLTQGNDARLRYKATLTLLRIAPDHPSTEQAFERALRSKYSEGIVAEDLPQGVQPLIERLRARCRGRALCSVLEQLGATISRNTAVNTSAPFCATPIPS